MNTLSLKRIAQIPAALTELYGYVMKLLFFKQYSHNEKGNLLADQARFGAVLHIKGGRHVRIR